MSFCHFGKTFDLATFSSNRALHWSLNEPTAFAPLFAIPFVKSA